MGVFVSWTWGKSPTVPVSFLVADVKVPVEWFRTPQVASGSEVFVA